MNRGCRELWQLANSVLQAEKERVENAVRSYLAEKPAEDAIRDQELQKAQAENSDIQRALDEAAAQRDGLQVYNLSFPSPSSSSFITSSSVSAMYENIR